MAKIRQLKYNGEDRWEVDFGYDADGKRLRPWFKTEKEADKAIGDREKEIKRCGEWWSGLSNNDRLLIQSTCKQMKDANRRIDTVWADWERWQKDQSESCVTTMAFGEVVKEWKITKLAAGNGERYCDDLEGTFLKFGEGRMEVPIHRIPAKAVEDWINAQPTWSNTSKNTRQAHFSSLWTLAKKRGWTSVKLLERMERVKRDPFDKKIWKNELVLRFLAALMSTKNHAMLPNVLQAFCCMRPEESTNPDLSWDLFDLKYGRIDLSAKVAKTDDQRVIRVQPTGLLWLKLCKKWEIPLPCVNERRDTDLACKIIGLEDWDRDGLRKTCLTHLRPVYKNDYDVVKDAGNSSRVLIERYAELHTPEPVSFAFWKIDPKAVKAYMKTPEWEKFLRGVSSNSSSPPKQKASASAKTAR